MHRKIWLRRSISDNPCVKGKWKSQSLHALGIAAAHETFTTNTQSIAGFWANLFQSYLAPSKELRWLDNGPGIGRDAKVAYSGLFGRYMARAHLMFREKIQILVPLEIARKELQKNNIYHIGKSPGSNGLEADWIGIDDEGLVIAESKGSFNSAKSPWKGKKSVPPLLHRAMEQAMRTEVYVSSKGTPLPARYWAVTSRWANEDNESEPTTIAWGRDRGKKDRNDHWKLKSALFRADLSSLMEGLGHPGIDNLQQQDSRSTIRYEGDLHLSVSGQNIGPGFMTVVGPIQSYPLRTIDDVNIFNFYNRIFAGTAPYLVLVSLSSRYINTVLRNQPGEILNFPWKVEINEVGEGLIIAKFAGLKVIWFSPQTPFDHWIRVLRTGDR